MPRKKQVKPSQVFMNDGTSVTVGTLVSYYRKGWRAGYLVEIIDARNVKIQPVAPQNARLVAALVTDLKEAK